MGFLGEKVKVTWNYVVMIRLTLEDGMWRLSSGLVLSFVLGSPSYGKWDNIDLAVSYQWR